MSRLETNGNENPRASLTVPFIIAALYFLAHMATATRYGYFRDALYYLACTEHLAWGYVDQPPLFVFLAWFARHTLGTSLPALIFWPALAGASRIVLTGAFARELGAKKFGTALAAVLAATPAVWYAIDHQFGMNAFDPLFWTGCAFALLRMIKTENPQWWIVFGAIAGLGLENKYAIGFYAACLLAGLLLTPQRKFLFSPWLFAGGAVALLLFLPNLLWNIQHHWPFLELMHNIRSSGRDVVLSPAGFLGQQLIMTTPLAFPFTLFGLYFYFSAAGKTFRVFGWTFVFTITFFLLAHGKDYYTAPVYPLVLAAGAVATERFLSRRSVRHTRSGLSPSPKFRRPTWSIRVSLRRRGSCFYPLFCPSCPSRPISAIKTICPSPSPSPNTIKTPPLSRNTTPTNSAGKKWSPKSPTSTTASRPKNKPKPPSLPLTTAKPPPSTSSARNTACPNPSALTRTISSGVRANTPAKSSSAWD